MKTRTAGLLSTAVIAISIAAILPARAASAPVHDTLPANAQAEWSKYFPGTAHIPDPELDLELLLESPDECRAIQRSVVADTIAYGRLAYKSNKGGSRKKGEAIIANLHKLEDSNSPCFESAARAYVATSLHLLNPSNSNDGALFNNARVDNRPMAMGLEITMLGAALLNHRDSGGAYTVQLLTPARRSKESAIWGQKTQKGDDYLVSAGYDCVDGGILLDPYIPALNLGAVFVHELDHLFRDRVSLPISTNAGLLALLQLTNPSHPIFALDSTPPEITLEITLDEGLASTVAAAFQRHMQWFHDYKAPLFPWLENSKGRKPLPFLLSDDLSLFRKDKHGPINVIWNLLQTGHPESLNQINASMSYFLYKSFLMGDQPQQALSQGMLDAVNQIYELIYRGYFGGAALSSDQLQELDPRRHGHKLDPLALWLDRAAVTVSDDDQYPLADGLWVREYSSKSYDTSVVHKGDTVRVGYSLGSLFDSLDIGFKQIFSSEEISPYCQRYLSGLENGTLANYVGMGLSSGFKPGETGVKPGETGVKPGDTGVKPALFRPCLNIGPEL